MHNANVAKQQISLTPGVGVTTACTNIRRHVKKVIPECTLTLVFMAAVIKIDPGCSMWHSVPGRTWRYSVVELLNVLPGIWIMFGHYNCDLPFNSGWVLLDLFFVIVSCCCFVVLIYLFCICFFYYCVLLFLLHPGVCACLCLFANLRKKYCMVLD